VAAGLEIEVERRAPGAIPGSTGRDLLVLAAFAATNLTIAVLAARRRGASR